MATRSVSVEPGDMECPVCHEHFTQPKILPCAHLLCHDCLVTWIKSEAEAVCPLCRCAIVAPDEKGSKSGEQIADGLPTDMAMAALVESEQILKKDHTCQACLNVPAISICLNCGDLMCKSCATIHTRMSMLRNHKVVDMTSLGPESLSASRPTFCSAHSDEPCKLFCPTHGVSICQLCATAKHRACPEVTELEEKLKEARAILDELATQLNAGESELERAMKELDEHLLEVEKNTQATLADIDAACDRLQKSAETCRKRLKELALKVKDDIASAVSGGKTVLLERRGKLTSHKRLVERVKFASPRSHLGDMATTLKTRITDLDRSTDLPKDAKVINKATLTVDLQAIAQIEKDLAGLGQVSLTPAAVSAKPRPTAPRFHQNHGSNITLSNGQQTAERTGGEGFAMAVFSEPMTVNRLYEVRLEQLDPGNSPGGNAFTGVVTTDPAVGGFRDVQYSCNMSAHCVIWNNTVVSCGVQMYSSVGAALATLGVGGRVGVLVDAVRKLHLYIDGKDQGVAASCIADPCYAFFDLGRGWIKVTSLPVRTIN